MPVELPNTSNRQLASGLLCAAASLIAAAIAVAAMNGTETSMRLGVRLSASTPMRSLVLGTGLAVLAGWLLRHAPIWRCAAWVAVGAHAALGLIAVATHHPQVWPIGDGAVIELYTLHAAEGRQLLGPYSRFGFHHPGPVMFYALAPFYAASGHQTPSLSAGALAINLASLGIISWVMVRAAAPIPLSLALSASLLTFVLRVPALLTSAWNPHLPVLPLVALVVVAASVASGDVRLAPLMAALASLVAQSHLGLAVASLVVSGGAIVAAAVRSALVLERRRSLACWLKRAAWVLVLLWAFPVAEQIVYRPGNLGRIVTFFFFEGEAGRVSTAAAWRAWSYSLMGLLRADFQLPLGWYFFPTPRPWLPGAVVLVALLVSVTAFKGWRLGREFPSALAGLTMAAAAVGFWSIGGIRFEIFDHAVFWLSGLGTTVVALAVSAPFLWTRVWAIQAPWCNVVRIAGGSALVVGAALVGGSNLARPPAPVGSADGAVRVFVDRIVRAMPEYDIQKPLLQVDGQAWEVMAGVLLQFAKTGVPVAADRRLVDVFDRPWLPTGDEDALVTIADAAGHERLSARMGNIAVAEYGGYFVDTVLVRNLE